MKNQFPDGPLSSPEWVEAIIANPDPVLRNLQITQSYSQITRDFAQVVDRDNVCWCAFATWASRQAGAFIRMKQVPEPFLEILGLDPDGKPSPRPWYWFVVPERILKTPRVLSYCRMTVEDISAQIARGNHKVYAKLAPIFAGFLKLAHEQSKPGPQALTALLEPYTHDPEIHEGVFQAFTNYFRVLSEQDPKVRAELIFAANVLIGQHEQIRLQEAIDGAMKAPVRQALGDPERRWTSWPLPDWLRNFLARITELLLSPAISRMERGWQKAATWGLMTLDTPTGTLRLGRDVPPLPGGEMFPEILREITMPEVKTLVAQFDYTSDTLTGSAAADWSSLADRLNYIIDLFRSRQRDKTLLEPPFSEEQTAAIGRGKKTLGEQ